jgi:hypothetical protein
MYMKRKRGEDVMENTIFLKRVWIENSEEKALSFSSFFQLQKISINVV